VTNNDILHHVRSIFGFDETTMVDVFGLAGSQVTQDQVIAWVGKNSDPTFEECSDSHLAMFLNGLIKFRRGDKDGVVPDPEQKITNNIIFHKLKIALDLQAEDVLEILALANITISKHELSALFRKPGNKHYRECEDSMLRGFFHGAQIMYGRDNPPAGDE
jgi:uncharacterized protein YehS (DUF1456 family)